MNIQEIEAVGLEDTTQEMVTSCPETELYVFCWMFTVGRLPVTSKNALSDPFPTWFVA